eukprot:Skav222144  [mRNA]  locus=scaffold1181:1138257:1140612:+ [translate_table: standard]
MPRQRPPPPLGVMAMGGPGGEYPEGEDPGDMVPGRLKRCCWFGPLGPPYIGGGPFPKFCCRGGPCICDGPIITGASRYDTGASFSVRMMFSSSLATACD